MGLGPGPSWCELCLSAKGTGQSPPAHIPVSLHPPRPFLVSVRGLSLPHPRHLYLVARNLPCCSYQLVAPELWPTSFLGRYVTATWCSVSCTELGEQEVCVWGGWGPHLLKSCSSVSCVALGSGNLRSQVYVGHPGPHPPQEWTSSGSSNPATQPLPPHPGLEWAAVRCRSMWDAGPWLV